MLRPAAIRSPALATASSTEVGATVMRGAAVHADRQRLEPAFDLHHGQKGLRRDGRARIARQEQERRRG